MVSKLSDIFYFENILVCEIEEDEKAFKFLELVSDNSFWFFYKTSVVHMALFEEGRKYKTNNESFLKNFVVSSNLQKGLSFALKARLNSKSFVESMKKFHIIYDKANINVISGHVLLRADVNGIA